jgi:hypothetical protein
VYYKASRHGPVCGSAISSCTLYRHGLFQQLGRPVSNPSYHLHGPHWLAGLGLRRSYTYLVYPQQAASAANKHFSGTIAGEKEDFCKWSLSLPIFYFVIILLTFFTLFLFASFYQKYKKISSFIVVIFTCLLFVLLE